MSVMEYASAIKSVTPVSRAGEGTRREQSEITAHNTREGDRTPHTKHTCEEQYTHAHRYQTEICPAADSSS